MRLKLVLNHWLVRWSRRSPRRSRSRGDRRRPEAVPRDDRGRPARPRLRAAEGQGDDRARVPARVPARARAQGRAGSCSRRPSGTDFDAALAATIEARWRRRSRPGTATRTWRRPTTPARASRLPRTHVRTDGDGQSSTWQDLAAVHLQGGPREDPRVRERGRRGQPRPPRPRRGAGGRLPRRRGAADVRGRLLRGRDGSGDPRPRGRHRPHADAARQPGVRLVASRSAPATRSRPRPSSRTCTRRTARSSSCSSRCRATRTARRSCAAPGPTSFEEAE